MMTARRFRLKAFIGVCAVGLSAGGLAACTVVEQPAPPAYRPPPPVAYAPPVYQPAPPRPVYQPPPLRVEVIPPPPPGAYVWQPGHWDWAGGNNYRWAPGRYVYRQAAYHQWVHGHWAVINGNPVWIPGHWQ